MSFLRRAATTYCPRCHRPYLNWNRHLRICPGR